MAAHPPDPQRLDVLRARIDAIDDQLQDLLIERAALVGEVSQRKRTDQIPPFRPGREAQILRRLVGRHRGAFPLGALVRIWREMIATGIAMQTELTVVFGPGCSELAHGHFGSLAPMLELPSDEVILAVRERRATVGVLAFPDGEPEPWWVSLADLVEGQRPRVIARLPFGIAATDVPVQDALVIALMDPEPSGDDCTLFAIGAPSALPAAQITDAFLAAGLDCTPAAEVARAGGTIALVEVEAMLGVGDARVQKALKQLGSGIKTTWLGAYARPLPDAAVADISPG